MHVRKTIKNKQHNQHLFEQKKQIILTNKLQFLELQLSDAKKRVENLKESNRTMINTLEELYNYNDKQNYDNNFDEVSCDGQKQHEKVVRNLKKYMQNQIDELKERYFEQHIKKQQMLRSKQQEIKQYKELCEDLLRKTRVQRKSINLFNSKSRRSSPYQSISNSVSYNDNSILRDRSVTYLEERSFLGMANQSKQKKQYSRTKQLETNRKQASLLNSMVTERSSCTSKTTTRIITTIRCEICKIPYKPNQYYRHIESCRNRQKERLLMEKQKINRKIQKLNVSTTQI